MKNVHTPISSASRVLTSPRNGALIPFMAAAKDKRQLMKEAGGLESLQISAASASHLAMLASGAFLPIDRFLGERDYRSVMQSMRLTNGVLWPVPITLPAGEGKGFRAGSRIALRDMQNRLLACMTVEESFEVMRTELRHARNGGSRGAGHTWSERAISGPMDVFYIPADLQFPDLWRDPAAVHKELSLHGGKAVISVDAWEPRDAESTEWLRALAHDRNAVLLLNLAGAEQRLDELSHFRHLRECVDAFHNCFSSSRAMLNFVHLDAQLSSEQQILWHAIVHKNYGASSYVVDTSRWRGRKNVADGEMLRASKLLQDGAAEIGVELIFNAARTGTSRKAFPITAAQPSAGPASGIMDELPCQTSRSAFPPPTILQVPSEWGVCLWFTGLPCSGKSTIAEQLLVLLMEGGLRVTLLDGDTVRTHLSKGLSFSKEDRDTNVQRIGFVASEIVRHRGIVICAAVSPWRETRDIVRQMMPDASFVEIFVDTPVEECERRDVKGFYARARAGQLDHFTGVNDPYEAPLQPEAVLQTEGVTEQENAESLLQFLIREKYLSDASKDGADTL